MPKQDNFLDGRADLANYREMSKPHATRNALNDAVTAFYKDVYDLRNKHKLQDVFVIVHAASLDADGQEVTGLSRYHAGCVSNSLEMAAWAYGAEQEEHENHITKLASPKKHRI